MDETEHFDDVTCKRETDKAILVEVEGDERWVPKSVVHEDSEVKFKDDEGLLVLKHWWAESEGWV